MYQMYILKYIAYDSLEPVQQLQIVFKIEGWAQAKVIVHVFAVIGTPGCYKHLPHGRQGQAPFINGLEFILQGCQYFYRIFHGGMRKHIY